MATETDYQTLAGAIDDLARRGFTESLAVVGNERTQDRARAERMAAQIEAGSVFVNEIGRAHV